MLQVTLNPSKDNRIASDAPTTNYGTSNVWEIGEYNAGVITERELVQFDLSSIPAGSIITAVTLRAYDTGVNYSDNTRTMRCYRGRRAWGETTSNWNTTDGSTAWTTAGADDTTNDREATDIGSISMPATEAAGYVEITITASAVQEWFTGAFANNGFVIRMDTETDDMHQFNSREAVSNKPELVVTYTEGSASASASESKSLSPSASESKSESKSASASESKSQSPSASESASASRSASASGSASASASESKSASASASASGSASASASESKSASASASASGSKSASASESKSASKSQSASASASPSPASYTAKYTAVVGNTYTAKYTEWSDLPD